MTVKQEQINPQVQTGTADSTPATASTVSQDQPKSSPTLPPPTMSQGEKLYNRVVYQGINYWLNLGLSLVVADYFLHGKGRPFYEKSMVNINHAFRSVKLDHAIGETAMKRATDVALGFVSLNSGGNIILVPMKLMEDKKRPIVHWMNKNIYHDQQLAPDGHQETPDEIYIEQEQPKQSWANVIFRRLKAMAASITFGLALDNLGRKTLDAPQVINGKTVSHIDGQERFTGWAVSNVNKVLNSGFIPGGKIAANNATAQRYLGYAALDTINTLITSHVMHKTNGAQKAKLPHEIGDEVDPPGITGTDEIVLLPKDEKLVDINQPVEGSSALEKYRKKAIAPASSHADRAKATNSPMSVTP